MGIKERVREGGNKLRCTGRGTQISSMQRVKNVMKIIGEMGRLKGRKWDILQEENMYPYQQALSQRAILDFNLSTASETFIIHQKIN